MNVYFKTTIYKFNIIDCISRVDGLNNINRKKFFFFDSFTVSHT